MSKELLQKLKKEKARLLMIAKEKKAARVEMQKVKIEERKLKRDIKILKESTRNNLLRKIKRLVKDPENKRRIRKAKIAYKQLWDSFQKFAKKYGD